MKCVDCGFYSKKGRLCILGDGEDIDPSTDACQDFELMHGKFIVLEGSDGVGTTTQCSRIVENLKKALGEEKVFSTFEPTSSDIGHFIKRILKKEISAPTKKSLEYLFRADRINHIDEIREKLNSGISVVCDRYFVSTLVYQGLCESLKGSLMNMDTMYMSFMEDGILKPDLILILEADLQTCMDRIEGRDTKEIFDDIVLQMKIKELYSKWTTTDGAKTLVYEVIDANGRIEEVNGACMKYIEALYV